MQRQYRLRKRSHFNQVYRRGKSAANRHLVLLYLPGRHVQLGISVSRKLGNAVRRNLVKRRLRECARPHLAQMRPGRYVLIARESASGATFRELSASFANLLARGQYLRADKS